MKMCTGIVGVSRSLLSRESRRRISKAIAVHGDMLDSPASRIVVNEYTGGLVPRASHRQ
jgi:hypothetical protein